ncbi:MAG: branched-chain amino acid ABC transporter permease [Chloroflexi bacterium]|nr:branched-chain amino acid ABC transporter permease [Chloroflexota bacterium]
MIVSLLVYGLVNSVVLILTALGFSLTFGLSKVANFAHGGLYLLSGFVAWLILNKLGLPYGVAMVMAVIATGVLGALIYQFILLRVRGTELSEVISTFAVGVAILESFRYLAVLLWLFTHHTKTGLALRGIAQDEHTALTLGIESDWAAMFSVALGAALTAVAALTILPLGIISINLGYEVLLIAVAVSVLGGLESTVGLIIAGLILGYSQVIASTVWGPQWQMVVYLAAIVLVLAVKPSGLLGKFKELEERV